MSSKISSLLWPRRREPLVVQSQAPKHADKHRLGETQGSSNEHEVPMEKSADSLAKTKTGPVSSQTRAHAAHARSSQRRVRSLRQTLPVAWRSGSPDWSDTEAEQLVPKMPVRPLKSAKRPVFNQPPKQSFAYTLPTLSESSEQSVTDAAPPTPSSSWTSSQSDATHLHAALKFTIDTLCARLATLPAHLSLKRADFEEALENRSAHWQIDVLTSFERVIARNEAVAPHLAMLLGHWSRLTGEERRVLLAQLEQTRPHFDLKAFGSVLERDLRRLALASAEERRRITIIAASMTGRDLLPLSDWLKEAARFRRSEQTLRSVARLTHELAPPHATNATLSHIYQWLMQQDVTTRASLAVTMHRIEGLVVRGTLRAKGQSNLSAMRFVAEHATQIVALLQIFVAIAPSDRDRCVSWLEKVAGEVSMCPSIEQSLRNVSLLLALAPVASTIAPEANALDGRDFLQSKALQTLHIEDVAFAARATHFICENVQQACRLTLEQKHLAAVLAISLRLCVLPAAARQSALEFLGFGLHQEKFAHQRTLALEFASKKLEAILRCWPTN